jgi:uncharacterized protein YmfQ (DUF2313 family)
MSRHGDLLTRLLPPVSYTSRAPYTTAEMESVGAVMDAVLARSADLLTEADPRSVAESLTDWERVYGLPDPCVGPGQSFALRRAALVAKVDGQGGLSREYFIELAARLGYTITIDEFSPHSVVSPVDHPLYHEDIRFYWRVNAPLTNTFYHSVLGPVSEALVVTSNQLLECVFNRLKPAHTVLVFNYS